METTETTKCYPFSFTNGQPEKALVIFRHGPYGRSYFGSGGAFGKVVATLNGEDITARVEFLIGDNGFVAGPVGVLSAPEGTRIVAKGGDNIDIEGRRWEEEHTL